MGFTTRELIGGGAGRAHPRSDRCVWGIHRGSSDVGLFEQAAYSANEVRQ